MSILLSLREPMEQLVEECQSADALIYPNERENPQKVKEVAKRLEALDEVSKVYLCGVQSNSSSR